MLGAGPPLYLAAEHTSFSLHEVQALIFPQMKSYPELGKGGWGRRVHSGSSERMLTDELEIMHQRFK